MKALRLIPLLFVALAASYAQQDLLVPGGNGTSPYTLLQRGANWAGSGPSNMSNNYIFHPTDPNEGFCLFVTNNNPTNSHNFTVLVAQTGDPSLNAYAGFTGQWFTVPTSTTFPVTVNASSTIGINYKTTASAGIVVVITGNASAAGSPDTANVFAVQTSASACGSIPTNSVQGPFNQGSTVPNTNQFPVLIGGLTAPGLTSTVIPFVVGSSGSGGLLQDASTCCQPLNNSFVSVSTFGENRDFSAGSEKPAIQDSVSAVTLGVKGVYGGGVKTNFLEWLGDYNQVGPGSETAWIVLGKLTNPAANAVLLEHFLTNTMPGNVVYKQLIINCSAACEIIVNRIAARGTTCTALTPQNLQVGNNNVAGTPNAQDITENACTTGPTLGTAMYDIPAGANQFTNIDLSGFSNFHSATTGGGIIVEVLTGFTGVATASLLWGEA